MTDPVQRVVILGGGSAGFLTALALKAKMPGLSVLVVRSKDIGIIGVGEGSTAGLTTFLHGYVGVKPATFFEVAQPTWKLGLRFLWGPRPYFNYTFTDQFGGRINGLPKTNASYCWEDMEFGDPVSAMMSQNRVFERCQTGEPVFHGSVAYHVENEKFVRFLEAFAIGLGVAVLDDTVTSVERADTGVTALNLSSGRRETADLYVDASGFASVLLGKALAEPFVSYESSLFCDRAVVGGWERGGAEEEVVKPYTTCETMESGWAWQIEHETRINRGYVYSSAFVSDAAAEAEFRARNPKVGPTRVVRFVSGRYRNLWVKNVLAVGNAGGFVEPLEATALGMIAHQSLFLVETLLAGDRTVTPSARRQYNRLETTMWDDIRDFLAVHYKFNTRLDTPFWRHCRTATDLGGAEEFVSVYRENGPCLWLARTLDRSNHFGVHGYLALLLGQQVEYERRYTPPQQELQIWNAARTRHKEAASRGLTVRETLAAIRSPNWRWQ